MTSVLQQSMGSPSGGTTSITYSDTQQRSTALTVGATYYFDVSDGTYMTFGNSTVNVEAANRILMFPGNNGPFTIKSGANYVVAKNFSGTASTTMEITKTLV